MADFKDHFYLGKIVKKHGFDGKVHLYLDTDEPYEYENLEMVFLNISGSLVPYFIDKIQIQGNKALASFMDVVSADDAELLIDKEMYLPLSMLPVLEGNKFYFHEAKGMTIIDRSMGELGKVETVLEYPNQAVFQVYHKNKEVLIPISDEIIIEFNRKDKFILVNSPDGLLDLYLNS